MIIRKYFFLFTLFVYVNLHAQSGFQRLITNGAQGKSMGTSSIQTADSSFVICNSSFTSGGLHLIRMSNSGSILQEKSLGIPIGFSSNKMMQQTNDGGYIIGNFNYLAKLDQNLNVLWSKSYNASGTFGSNAHSVLQTKEGNYLSVSDHYNGTRTELHLSRVGSNGTIIWSKIIADSNNINIDPFHNMIAENVIQTLDSGFVIVGSYRGFVTYESDDILLLKINSLGNLLWAKRIGGVGDEYAKSLIELENGNIMLFGSTQNFGSIEGSLFLMKLNNLGEIGWSYSYGGPDNDSPKDFVSTSDGGFVMGAYSESFSTFSKYLLMRTDSTGNIRWSNTYGGYFSHAGNGNVLQTFDGGFLMNGYAVLDSNAIRYNTFLVKTDSLGNSGCSAQQAVSLNKQDLFFGTFDLQLFEQPGFVLNTTAINLPNNSYQISDCLLTAISNISQKEIHKINILRNPFTTETTIISDLFLTNAKLKIVNMIGQTVQEICNINGTSITLYRNNLSSGLYFIKLYENNSLIAENKVVIE